MKWVFLGVALLLWGAFLTAGEVRPGFQVVPDWPKLPKGYVLSHVTGVGVDSHNHVFVFHRGNPPVFCFDGTTGEVLASWGEGLFEVAHGLTLDAEDNIWVTDIGRHQVLKFSHDGELLMAVGAKGVPGLDGRHFNMPTDVAVTRNGEFYVSDGYGNSRVAKFSAQGVFLFDWGRKGDQPGEFDLPHGICADAEGRVYVADRRNSRIQVFDQNGRFLHQWKSPELGRPWGLDIGPDGLLYVVDGGDLRPEPPDRGRVLKLDLQGRILEEWGTYGNYAGQLFWGHDVAVSRRGDVYVTDIHGRRVQKFVRK